jgi:glutamate synthase (NADPH/NADH) small chain
MHFAILQNVKDYSTRIRTLREPKMPASLVIFGNLGKGESKMEQKTMRELETKCIQESPPGCITACPVHVDARALILAVQKEDFKTGASILKKAIPFPRIISRICDEPCQNQCKRGELDEPIAINALEKICIDHGDILENKGKFVPKKDKRVAVVGGGLSGLTVAWELAQKGYKIVILEKNEYLGGSIRDISEEILPKKFIEADLLQIEKNPLIEIKLNTPVGTGNAQVSLSELCENFAAVYVGIGEEKFSFLGVDFETDSQGNLLFDPLTLQTNHPKIFFGGTMLLGLANKSPIVSIYHGKSAANSIDRFLQNVSLTANRDKEGPYPTSLYTNIKGIKPQKRVIALDAHKGYTKTEAILEAKRCLQCECLECVKACEYLAHYGSYPKRYVREIYNNLSIVMGIRRANKMINSCSLCGLCREVCPNGLNMGEICQAARRTMVETGKMPPTYDFALRDMQFSTCEKFVLNRHQPGFTSSKVLFFPGCQLSASKPHYVQEVYSFLCQKISGGVGLSLGCCGAPAEWAGQNDLFKETIDNIAQELFSLDSPQIITGCPTCYSIFRREIPGVKVETIWTILDKIGLPKNRGETIAPRKLAIHDACTTRNEKELQESVRRILSKLGHEIVELDHSQETTECCGYGGLMSFANKEVTKKVRQRRIKESDTDYLAYCAMCRDNYAKEGKKIFHLLDLLFGDKQLTGEEKGPGFSLRQENRARLKKTFLKEVWGEKLIEEDNNINLVIPENVQQILEDRMILEEDLKTVITQAESTGSKFKNTEKNTFIAYFRPISVTYWVEYSKEDENFIVHNAYCHRLEING